jgi:molybdopterin-biosynthesis enzyme MoeA-like protein
MVKPIHAIIIGDEILSGKRNDKHLNHLSKVLSSKGLNLIKADFIQDDLKVIADTIKSKLQCIVFCFGGIGATPDDCTRQAAGKAHNKKITRNPEALKLIVDKFGDDAFPKRVLMSDLPEGAHLIPNTINDIPGFFINEHYFMPGFPEMSWPMVDWILETQYSNQLNDQKLDSSVWIDGVPESMLIDLMNEVTKNHPNIKIYSLPKLEPKIKVELGVKGNIVDVKKAIEDIKKGLSAQNHKWYEN